ncbi:MAG: hypothetical protein EA351_04365 [Gemmatimonadales bacterium]|nr:MAG: hypothetical protein EA351_04365 [Gemmatimonadales bacterium]
MPCVVGMIGVSRVSGMDRVDRIAARLMAAGMRAGLYRCGLDEQVVMGTVVHAPDVDGPAGKKRDERKDPDGAATGAES